MKEGVRTEGTQFVKELPDRFNELGSFIREQRNSARLSLRRLSELAGISNPYLSQIERGLRRPSAEILQQIARALRISAETLYVQAGILDKPDGDTDLSQYIFADRHLTEEQRQAIMRIYLSFRHENEDEAEGRRVASLAEHRDPETPDSSGPTRAPARAAANATTAVPRAAAATTPTAGVVAEVSNVPGGNGSTAGAG